MSISPPQSPSAGRDGLGDLDTAVNAGARNQRKLVAQSKSRYMILYFKCTYILLVLCVLIHIYALFLLLMYIYRASFSDTSSKSTGITTNTDSTFASLTGSAKMRLSASLQSMHGMFASSRINSRVSIKTRASIGPPSPVKVYASPSFSLARAGSDLSAGNPSPVRTGITSPFVSPRQPGQREGNRRFSKEDLHDGHIINPNLAVNGLGKIEGHSPLEAWSGDHSPGHRASPYGTHNSSMVELFDAHGMYTLYYLYKHTLYH